MGTIAPPGLIAVQPQLGENGGAPGPSGQTILQARGDTAYTTEWDSAEQAALDSALARFPADRHPPLERYVRAAACLPKKNVRDVALRVAWLRATAAARKRKMADEANSKKQVRRERGQSIFAVQPKPMGGAGVGNPMASSVGLGMAAMPGPNIAMASGMPMPAPIVVQPHGMAYAQPVVPLAPMPQLDDHGAGTVGGVGGPLAQLLEQNYAILNQFKQNMAAYKVNENTELLVRFRDNILTVLNHMNSMQGVMQQMPPLPVRLNVELANNFLPKAVANGMCQFSYVPPPGGMSSGPMLVQQGSSAGMAAPSVPTSAPVAAVTSSAAPALPAVSAPVALPPPEPSSGPAFAQPLQPLQMQQQPQLQPQPAQMQQQQQQQPLPPPASAAVPAGVTAGVSAAAPIPAQWAANGLPAASMPVMSMPVVSMPAVSMPAAAASASAVQVAPVQQPQPAAAQPAAPTAVPTAAPSNTVLETPLVLADVAIKQEPVAHPSKPAVLQQPGPPGTSQPASLQSAAAPPEPKVEPPASAVAPPQQLPSPAVAVEPSPPPPAQLPPREEPAVAAPEAPPVKTPPVEQPSMPVLANGAVSSEAPTAVPAPSQPSQSDVPAANPCVTSSPKAGIGTRSSSAAQLSPSRPSRSTRSMAAKRNPSAAASPSTSKGPG